MHIQLKAIESTGKNEYIMVCDCHKGTRDSANYTLTACFLLAALKYRLVRNQNNAALKGPSPTIT